MPSNVNFIGKFQALMRRGHMRLVGGQILVVAGVMLVAAIMLLGVNLSHQRESFAEDVRTADALLLIDDVEAKLVGVEMTVRGYALTGAPDFLRWQNRERKDLQRGLEKLAVAMKGEPTQTRRFVAMRTLIRQRLELYSYLSNPDHAREVAKAITDPKTRDVMDSTRANLRELRAAQRVLLDARQGATIADTRHTFFLAIGIVILAFVAGALGLLLSQCVGGKDI